MVVTTGPAARGQRFLDSTHAAVVSVRFRIGSPTDAGIGLRASFPPSTSPLPTVLEIDRLRASICRDYTPFDVLEHRSTAGPLAENWYQGSSEEGLPVRHHRQLEIRSVSTGLWRGASVRSGANREGVSGCVLENYPQTGLPGPYSRAKRWGTSSGLSARWPPGRDEPSGSLRAPSQTFPLMPDACSTHRSGRRPWSGITWVLQK